MSRVPLPPMQVVHVFVSIEVSSGIPFDASDYHAAKWAEQGYAVTKAPKDGRDHPLNEPCTVCPPLEPSE